MQRYNSNWQMSTILWLEEPRKCQNGEVLCHQKKRTRSNSSWQQMCNLQQWVVVVERQNVDGLILHLDSHWHRVITSVPRWPADDRRAHVIPALFKAMLTDVRNAHVHVALEINKKPQTSSDQFNSWMPPTDLKWLHVLFSIYSTAAANKHFFN